jgi:glycosyltransferase involved in cell wall biosynthesis
VTAEPAAMITGSLSLVLPAHNEAGNIEGVVNRALEVLPSLCSEFEIVIVNDGSVDGTREIAGRLAETHVSVVAIHHERNRGYGGALLTGFAAATGDWVMLMDADRQFDPADLVFLAPFVGTYDLVAGYRIRRQDPPHRLLYAWIFKLAVRLLFGLRFRDIDCAFKVMRGDLLREIELTSPGALISTELLTRAVRAGVTWTEVGVNHYPRAAGEQSGGSASVVFRAMKDILLLWYRINRDAPVDRSAPGLSLVGGVSIAIASTMSMVALVARAILRRRT